MSHDLDAERPETAASHPLSPDDPTRVGTIRIVGRLGAGASSTVYLGETTTGERVAVKVLRPDWAASPDVRGLLQQEAALLERVHGTRIARVLEVDAQAETPYLVTEFVPGAPLSQRLPAHPLHGAELFSVLAGIADALVEIHAAGVVHRDLKPANILYGSDGVRVVDFGIGFLGEVAGGTSSGALVGTPGWISPEQATGAPIGAASDVFAFGLLIPYLSTGAFPFGQGRPDAVLYRVVNSEPDLSGLPDGLGELARACLSKDPGERPTAAQVAERLAALSGVGRSADAASPETVIASPTALGRLATEAAQARSTRSPGALRRPVVLAAAAVLAVLLIVLGVVTANAVVPFGGGIAVAYRLKTPGNTFYEAPTLHIAVDNGKGTDLRLDQLSAKKAVGAWRPGSRITVSYEPVFTKDQRYSRTFRAEELGMSLLTIGQPLVIGVEITDDTVHLAFQPSSVWGAPKPRTVAFDRANEQVYRAGEYKAYQACVTATSAAWSAHLATLVGIRETYNAVYSAHGFGSGGEADHDVWASRASGIANDLFDKLATATEESKAPLAGGALDYTDSVANSATAVSNALSSVITDWDSYSNALSGMSTAGNLNDLLPRENKLIEMDVNTLWSSVDDLNGALSRGADSACAAQYPDGV